jgi:hypothetical protein
MIIQLPNGRIIECSLELYLELEDYEIQELNGLGPMYTKDTDGNPFYSSFAGKKAAEAAFEDMDEYEPSLDEIDNIEKLEDPDFLPDDI